MKIYKVKKKRRENSERRKKKINPENPQDQALIYYQLHYGEKRVLKALYRNVLYGEKNVFVVLGDTKIHCRIFTKNMCIFFKKASNNIS